MHQNILENEESLFHSDFHFVRWPVFQLYRNLVVVVINIFVLNPFYRCSVYVLVFLVFFTQDVYAMPYKHPFLNRLQMLSSSFLLLFTVSNIPASISFMGDIMAVPDMDNALDGLKYLQILMVGLIPFSLVGWKGWEFYKERFL